MPAVEAAWARTGHHLRALTAAPVHANLEAWYARLCERPACRAHVMRPFGELFGRLAF